MAVLSSSDMIAELRQAPAMAHDMNETQSASLSEAE